MARQDFFRQRKIAFYVLRQVLGGRRRYPLALMLEPLFRCNLACPGCGKIDHPDAILNRRLSAQECLEAVDECGAPMVALLGGEPLIHREIGEITRGIVARKKFVNLCTNALLLDKKLGLFEPSPYLTFSIHLDGLRQRHDAAVAQPGVFDIVTAAIAKAKARGFNVTVNTTIFDGVRPEEVAAFLDFASALDVGVSISPGYAYERAPDQEHFLSRDKTKTLFRRIFALGARRRPAWGLLHTGMYLDFLAGNRTFQCAPWGMPTRNVFGWQRPCYLLGEGHAASFRALMDDTDWEKYGVGRNEKCANCMAHCGYEARAADAVMRHPLSAFWLWLRGLRVDGPMAPEACSTGPPALARRKTSEGADLAAPRPKLGA